MSDFALRYRELVPCKSNAGVVHLSELVRYRRELADYLRETEDPDGQLRANLADVTYVLAEFAQQIPPLVGLLVHDDYFNNWVHAEACERGWVARHGPVDDALTAAPNLRWELAEQLIGLDYFKIASIYSDGRFSAEVPKSVSGFDGDWLYPTGKA